ncbi:MAG: flagellar export chaperone FliS [Symbiobacteriia bacterium]
MVTRPYQQYFETQVQTATPGQLVLMLYDGAVRFTRLGQRALVAGDREEANRVIGRATAILQELMATLNPDAGDLAGQFWSLYEFTLTRLLQAQLRADPTLLDSPILVLVTLKEAWEQVLGQTAAPRVPAMATRALAGQA